MLTEYYEAGVASWELFSGPISLTGFTPIDVRVEKIPGQHFYIFFYNEVDEFSLNQNQIVQPEVVLYVC